jgi:hypothetical protein
MTYKLTLILNTLWFGSAFWYFSLKHETAAKLLVPKSQRDSPVFKTFSAALPFLGGMNLAFSLLALLLLLNPELFVQSSEKILLCIVFAVAHATQFWINVPIARAGGRLGESYWNVLSGPMLFIFVVDAIMVTVNLACAIILF